jgi:hypothetical protein
VSNSGISDGFKFVVLLATVHNYFESLEWLNNKLEAVINLDLKNSTAILHFICKFDVHLSDSPWFIL